MRTRIKKTTYHDGSVRYFPQYNSYLHEDGIWSTMDEAFNSNAWTARGGMLYLTDCENIIKVYLNKQPIKCEYIQETDGVEEEPISKLEIIIPHLFSCAIICSVVGYGIYLMTY